MRKIDCYIEEYQNRNGSLGARLRDKETDKKVVITGKFVEKKDILRYLSKAKIYPQFLPTVFDRDGSDVVAVRGDVSGETEHTIRVVIGHKFGSGYVFE